jgi:hypothetical protein
MAGSNSARADRRLWPRDQTELYFLVGCLNYLMAVAADALGYRPAGEELIRAGWAYATAINHRPLMAQLRLELAYISYWQGRPRQARDLAASGLEYLSIGPNGAHLYLHYARAAGNLGEVDAARRAIAQAHDARDREYDDELLEMEGEFGISQATHHYFYFAGSALTEIEIEDAQREATSELEQATRL